MKKKWIFISALASVTFWMTISLTAIWKIQELMTISLENEILYLKEEQIPLRFEILEKNHDKTKVKIKFYDLTDEDRITTKKNILKEEIFELEGEVLYLNIESYRFSNGNYIFFPTKIFTDKIASIDGKDLTSFYTKSGFPEIYKGLKKNHGAEKELSKIFSILKNNENFTGLEENKLDDEGFHWGNAVHEVKELEGFSLNTVYEIVCKKATGGVIITKE